MFYGYSKHSNEVIACSRVQYLKYTRDTLHTYSDLVRVTAKSARREMIAWIEAYGKHCGDYDVYTWGDYSNADILKLYVEKWTDALIDSDFDYELDFDFVDDVISNLY